jgi:hypothetical protein
MYLIWRDMVMSTQGENSRCDDDGAWVAEAARNAVEVESKKAIAAGYHVERTPDGSIVRVKGCRPVFVKRNSVAIENGKRYTLKTH